MVVLLQHRASHTSFTDEVASHSRFTVKRNVVETLHDVATSAINVIHVDSDRANAGATKIRTTKINSDDHIQHFTKISTHENNLLYGRRSDIISDTSYIILEVRYHIGHLLYHIGGPI